MRRIILVFLVLGYPFKAKAEECVLDLETAWERVVLSSPSLAIADNHVLARDAERRQVSTLINPVLEVEAENLGVSNPNDETEPPQTTIALAQTLELGGKRLARKTLANSITSIALWDAQIERLEIRKALILGFISVSAAQEKWRLAVDKEVIAGKILETEGLQCEGGKVSPIQYKQSQISYKAAQLATKEAFSQFQQEKKALAALWGDPCPDFDCVAFNLFSYELPPCEEFVMNEVFQLPDFARAKQEIFSANYNLRLQKANSIPDVTVTGGYRYFHDSHQHGWIVGAAMPIPIFNLNQGNIAKARVEIHQAELQLEEVERILRQRLGFSLEKLTISFEESESIRQGILADALDAYCLTEAAFQQGKLEYMDLLEAQKILFEIREKYIDVLYEYHINRAELARLTGDFNYICAE